VNLLELNIVIDCLVEKQRRNLRRTKKREGGKKWDGQIGLN